MHCVPQFSREIIGKQCVTFHLAGLAALRASGLQKRQEKIITVVGIFPLGM